MNPMLARSVEIPVLESQVDTPPSPQIAAKRVRQEMASTILAK